MKTIIGKNSFDGILSFRYVRYFNNYSNNILDIIKGVRWLCLLNNKKEIENIRKKVVPILKKNGVLKAGLFGSVVRGEEKRRSDIDILVKFPKGKSLLDLVGLKLELEETLRKKVDIVTYNSIYHLLKEKILNEEVRIYEKR